MKKLLLILLFTLPLLANIIELEKKEYLLSFNSKNYNLSDLNFNDYSFENHTFKENHKKLYTFAFNNIYHSILKKKEDSISFDKVIELEEKYYRRVITLEEKDNLFKELYKINFFKTIVIPSKIIEEYYQDNIEEFYTAPAIKIFEIKAKTKEEAKEIRNKIIYTFDKEAMMNDLILKQNKKISKHKVWQTEKMLNEKYKSMNFDYLMKMKEKYEISKVNFNFKDESGLSVIVLLEKVDSMLVTFNIAKYDIEEYLKQDLWESKQELMQLKITKKDIKINFNTLKKLSKQKGNK